MEQMYKRDNITILAGGLHPALLYMYSRFSNIEMRVTRTDFRLTCYLFACHVRDTKFEKFEYHIALRTLRWESCNYVSATRWWKEMAKNLRNYIYLLYKYIFYI